MNRFLLLLATALVVSWSYADTPRKKQNSDAGNFLRSLFHGNNPTPTPRPIRKKKRTEQKRDEPKDKSHVVDADWMARYLQQESNWDYPIPEDALIKFKDGSYHVPPVVFKHYEDLLSTPRRSPTPTPTVKPTPVPASHFD